MWGNVKKSSTAESAATAQKVEGESEDTPGATLGCSIAVNGVCLTAFEFDESSARFGLAPETLRRSNLVSLKTGDPVNLETDLLGKYVLRQLNR